MTTVGKILVVLHLVLSIVFMAFAGAVFTAQKNWRTIATTNINELNKTKTKLQDQKSEFEREKADQALKLGELSNEVAKLTGEKAALSNQVVASNAEISNLTLQLDGIKDQANLNAIETTERQLETKTRLVENSKSYETRTELIKKYHEVEDKRYALEIQMQQLVDRHQRVLDDLQTIKRYNSSKGYLTDPRQMQAQTTPPPPVEGKIQEYLKDKKNGAELVTISLGSDDGLSEGHRMTVFNAQKGFLGIIRLTHVEADNAVGVVVSKAKNMVIKEGDKVTTKI